MIYIYISSSFILCQFLVQSVFACCLFAFFPCFLMGILHHAVQAKIGTIDFTFS